MTSLLQVQNFYKATLVLPVALANTIGRFSVSVLPTVTSGYLVISSSNTSKREIIFYDSIGTDANGPYVNVPDVASRGLGGTTAQPHEAQETIRMNVTAQHWADMIVEVLTNIPASIASVAAQVASKASLTLANIFSGVNTFTVSPQVPTPTSANDAVNLAYVLALSFGSAVVGFNTSTITYDSAGRVKNVRDNQLGIMYSISYDSNDNPVKIFNGTSTWRINYTGDNVTSITKNN